eukprot:TRINITY_DN174_c3_g1_i2.p1 TRINITY_DN174_c3_g1~~TRINITY_DN174_c3_g1_i2.p1  ORF type:complete len:732 (+),score=159.07 TRINITY_DN174_c3_g1_i2:2-2197(+)
MPLCQCSQGACRCTRPSRTKITAPRVESEGGSESFIESVYHSDTATAAGALLLSAEARTRSAARMPPHASSSSSSSPSPSSSSPPTTPWASSVLPHPGMLIAVPSPPLTGQVSPGPSPGLSPGLNPVGPVVSPSRPLRQSMGAASLAAAGFGSAAAQQAALSSSGGLAAKYSTLRSTHTQSQLDTNQILQQQSQSHSPPQQLASPQLHNSAKSRNTIKHSPFFTSHPPPPPTSPKNLMGADFKKMSREDLEKHCQEISEELYKKNTQLKQEYDTKIEALSNIESILNSLPLRGTSFETGSLTIKRNAIKLIEKQNGKISFQYTQEIDNYFDKSKPRDVQTQISPSLCAWITNPMTGVTSKLPHSCFLITKTSSKIIIERDSEDEIIDSSLRWLWYSNPEINPVFSTINERISCERPSLSPALEKQLLKLLETYSIDDVGHGGKTLLHSACYAGNTELSRWLISRGASINIQDWHGWTPLVSAISPGKFQTALLLLSNGASATIQTDTKSNALHYLTVHITQPNFILFPPSSSIPTGSVSTLGAQSLSAQQASALQDHAQRHALYLELLMALLQKGCEPHQPNMRGETPFHNTVLSGNVDAMLTILKLSPSSLSFENGEGLTPLHLAVQRMHFEMIRELVLAGADVSAFSPIGTPMNIAMELNRPDIVSYLKSRCSVSIFDILSEANVSTILQYLSPKEVLSKRLVSISMKNACNKTILSDTFWEGKKTEVQ